jgi:hypothetical protein
MKQIILLVALVALAACKKSPEGLPDVGPTSEPIAPTTTVNGGIWSRATVFKTIVDGHTYLHVYGGGIIHSEGCTNHVNPFIGNIIYTN